MYNKLNQITGEFLIKTRFHLGESTDKISRLNFSYYIGFQNNFAIFDLEKTFWNLKYVYYHLISSFVDMNSFLIVATYAKLPTKKIFEDFKETANILLKKKNVDFFFLHKKWIVGLLSNWKIIYFYIKLLKKNKKLSKKKYSFLFGLLDKKSMPSLPDFLFLFFMESTRMQEILKTKKPILGIVSNKIQANQITFPIFGNYLSYNNIFFIFFLMLHAATEALEKDIFLFYNMILKKIYISLKKKN